MRKQETITVETSAGPADITVTQMGGNAGAQLSVRLVQLFGPGLVEIAGALNGADLSKLSNAASALASKLTVQEYEGIKKQVLAGAQAAIEGEFRDVDSGFIDDYFAGHAGSLFKLIGFALKVNFANFFQDLGVSDNLLKGLMKGSVKTGSSGQSGAPS